MAVTQLRCDERAQRIYDDARRRGHTKKEAMRVLKRHLSNVVYRTTMGDLRRRNRHRACRREGSMMITSAQALRVIHSALLPLDAVKERSAAPA